MSNFWGAVQLPIEFSYEGKSFVLFHSVVKYVIITTIQNKGD